MKVRRAKTRSDAGGMPHLVIEFEENDLPKATLTVEVARDLARGTGVFLGSEFQGLLPATQFQGKTLRGFTQDETVVALARRFLELTSSGEYTSGQTLMIGDEE